MIDQVVVGESIKTKQSVQHFVVCVDFVILLKQLASLSASIVK